MGKLCRREFKMKGGTVSYNKASNGGGVYVVDGGTFNMEDGKVSYNKASGADGGGGVRVYNSGTFSMSGNAEVSYNTTTNKGGGVLVDGSSSQFTVGGTAKVTNNTKTNALNNVYLDANKYITLGTGGNDVPIPANGMSVYVQTAANHDGVIVNLDANDTIKGYFHPDEEDKQVVRDGVQLKLIPKIEMVPVASGSFQMGNPDTTITGSDSERPVHTVTLTGFSMGKYEVTQAQWYAVMGTTIQQQQELATPSTDDYGRGDAFPVYYLSWYETLVFCNKLSMLEGLTPAYSISGNTDPAVWGTVPTSSNATWNAVIMVAGSTGYRLPTEAQWEYAAKGGNGSPGNYTYAGSNTVGDVAWYADNSNFTIHEVGGKAPNGLDIYDMTGNVFEPCWDWSGGYTSVDQIDPTGASSGSSRVCRGGSYTQPDERSRSVRRASISDLSSRDNYTGFRVVLPVQ